MVGVNVAVFPPATEAVAGDTEIVTGTNEIVALAVRLVAAWLVAVTVTV